MRGPASTLHGSGAIGGVVNVRTMSADSFLEADERFGTRLTAAREDHRRLIQALMNADLYENPEHEGTRYKAGPELWAQVPEFHYRPAAIASLLGAYAPALAAPMGWYPTLLALLMLTARRRGIT